MNLSSPIRYRSAVRVLVMGCPVSSSGLYNVQRLKSQYIDKSGQVCISTIQRMYSIRKDEPLDDALEEANPTEQLTKPEAPLIIDVVYFPEGAGGDHFEEKIFKGPLARITRDALSYIEAQYLKEFVVKHPDRAEAERFWNFPYAAIEEAVVNAVYHRSYEIREPMEVRIDKDELMVLSFPGPDRSIKLEDLHNGRAVSRRYRNRRIGEFLKELDLTEGRSTGLPKIFNKMAHNGSPRPIFETDDERTYFLVRLPVYEKVAELERAAEELKGQVTAEVTAELVAFLNVFKGEMTRAELMQKLNLQHAEHFRLGYLKKGLELKLIEMTIPDKPRSRLQKYRLTALGKQVLASAEGRT